MKDNNNVFLCSTNWAFSILNELLILGKHKVEKIEIYHNVSLPPEIKATFVCSINERTACLMLFTLTHIRSNDKLYINIKVDIDKYDTLDYILNKYDETFSLEHIDILNSDIPEEIVIEQTIKNMCKEIFSKSLNFIDDLLY